MINLFLSNLAANISNALDETSLDAETRASLTRGITRAYDQTAFDLGVNIDSDAIESLLA